MAIFAAMVNPKISRGRSLDSASLGPLRKYGLPDFEAKKSLKSVAKDRKATCADRYGTNFFELVIVAYLLCRKYRAFCVNLIRFSASAILACVAAYSLLWHASIRSQAFSVTAVSELEALPLRWCE